MRKFDKVCAERINEEVKKVPKGDHTITITNVEEGVNGFPLITFKTENPETAKLLLASNQWSEREIWKEAPTCASEKI